MRYLDLSCNYLIDSIPPEIGDLTQLYWLDLSGNQLSGDIPSSLSNLLLLLDRVDYNYTDLAFNCLTASDAELIDFINIADPDWAETQTACEAITATETDCTAVTEIPQMECEALVALYTSTDGPNWEDSANNNWNMTNTPCNWKGVTCEAGHVTSVDRKYDSGCNYEEHNYNLNGSIPSKIGNLNQLVHLDLACNHLTGSIPPEIGNLTQLTELILAFNQLSGSIPPEIGNLIQLTELNLGNNPLNGLIPPEIGNLTQLESLNLYENLLSGSIPPEIGNLTQLTRLYLADNSLSGSIPQEIGNLTQLNLLSLMFNQLSGSIPPEIGNLTQLTYLSLSHNQLSGSIPPEIGNLTQLTELYLADNSLSGSIPPEIGNLTQLVSLWLGNNQLSASIPPEIGHLTQLDTLILSGNQLSGSIPPEIGHLTQLMYLYLDSNQLSGSIPPEIGNLTQLYNLELNSNQLSGSIPPEIGNLIELYYLDLSKNQLSGDIPSSLSNLSRLLDGVDYDYTDLAFNCLTASDAELISFLNLVDPDWAGSQTACEAIDNNTTPILNPIGNNESIIQGENLTFTATATDAENNTLEFGLVNAPAGAKIAPNTGVFNWTLDSAGTFTVTITVTETDGNPTNLSDEETITITVEPAPIEETTTEITIVEPLPIEEDTIEIVENNTCLENAPTLPDFGNEVTNIWWDDLGFKAFAIGMAGKIVHWENFSLTEMLSGTTNDLFGIWGPNSSDLFVVGNNGTMLHYDGSTWTTMNSGTEKHLYNLWGPANNNVFAVGQAGTLMHYNGSQWAPINSNTTNDLFGIWGSAENNIFAVGLNGTILHYDGNQWTTMDSPTTIDLFSIWGTSANDIYATSEDNSTIIHYEGNQWTELVSGGLKETLDDYPELSDELGELNGILDYGDLELNNNLGLNLGTLPANNPNDCVNSNSEPVITEPTSEPAEVIVTDETSETENIPEPDPVEEKPNETPISIEPVITHPESEDLETETITEEENSLIGPDILEPQLEEYPIVVKTLGTGIVTGEGIDCGNDCTEIHARGSSVTLTATPEEGSNFSGWIGDCRGSNPSITITVDAALNCTAMFDVVPNRNLSINVTGEGQGTVMAPIGLGNGIDCGEICVENYPDGTTITLTTQPEIGSTFTGWIEKGCTEELTITNDMKCTATFELLPNYTLTVSTAEGNGTLITEPSGEVCGENCTRYVSGTEITLTAVPESDYRLLKWADDCEGTTASISFQLTTDMNCTAILEPKPTESTETDLESKSTESTEESTETDLESKPTESTETANDVVIIREELVPLPEPLRLTHKVK
ncbi:conserved hypothetical protein [Beggiatoa sp. PS]|nr:conserved hypothetical protein [Beggiatoa sp. PS]